MYLLYIYNGILYIHVIIRTIHLLITHTVMFSGMCRVKAAINNRKHSRSDLDKDADKTHNNRPNKRRKLNDDKKNKNSKGKHKKSKTKEKKKKNKGKHKHEDNTEAEAEEDEEDEEDLKGGLPYYAHLALHMQYNPNQSPLYNTNINNKKTTNIKQLLSLDSHSIVNIRYYFLCIHIISPYFYISAR